MIKVTITPFLTIFVPFYPFTDIYRHDNFIISITEALRTRTSLLQIQVNKLKLPYAQVRTEIAEQKEDADMRKAFTMFDK